MKKTLLSLAMVLTTTIALSQATYPNGMPIQRNCGTPVPPQQWDAWFNQKVSEYLQNNAAKLSVNTTAAVAYTVPVIVHVIHGGQAIGTYPNITNAQVVSQINILTADFGGTGQYTNHYPTTAFAAYATANSIPAPSYNGTRIIIGNAQITFLPAYYDQNNNALVEPGVDRINYNTLPAISGTTTSKNPAAYTNSTSFMSFLNNYIKPNTIWNVNKYMNIWVTDESSSVGLLGFATFPPGTGLGGLTSGLGTSTTDGLWCWAKAYGNTGAALAPYNLGRTATHEIGHWVGLRHIWGDGTCLTDYCNDTPPASGQNFVNQNTIATPSSAANANTVNYPYKANSCTGSPSNGSTGEMFMNFMDYSDDNAMYMFTTDQVTRIQTAMANSPIRNTLGTHGLTIPPPIASFAVSASTICTGQSLNVSNLSYGSPQSPSAYSYTVTGASTTTTTTQNPVITFTATGTQTITLIATANGTANSLPFTTTVSVGTGLTMSITATSASLCSGSSATLTATGATTYTWNTGGTGANLVITPTATTIYTVTGTAGSCSGNKTSTITVNTTPTVTVNSSSICSGSSATLTASGATTYSWNTGATTTSIVPSPTATTIYTVTGFNGTCSNVKTTTVNVTTTPTVAVNSSSICSGSSATITASGAATYSWSTGAATTSLVVSPTLTTVYTVTGTTSGCKNVKTTTVTVNTTPTVSVNSATICSGNSANLTASGATTYSWNTGATTTSLVVSPALTTVYTVTGTTSGCKNVKTTTVTVNTTPTVSVNSATICSGTSTNIAASGATTYSWNTGATTSSISVSPVTTAFYTVTGTSSGCSNVKTVTVTVKATPTISLSSFTICPGGSATLTASGATTYSWNTGSTSNPIVVSPAVTTVYTTTGTTLGCSSTKTSTVSIGSSLSIALTPGVQTICSGNSATLTASGATSYTWNPGNLSGTSIVITPTTNVTYNVVGSNGACTGSNTANINVAANPSLNVNSTAATCFGASNGSATLTAFGGSAPYTYSVNSGATSPVVGGLSAGNYTAVVTSSAGCSSTATFAIVQPSSAVGGSAVSSNASCGTCPDGSATVTPTGGTGPYTYTWSPSGGNGSSASNLAPACYTVTIADQSNCIASATTCVGFITGIKNNTTALNVVVYPNPTTGNVTVEFASIDNRTIEVTDMLGRVLSTESVNAQSVQLNLSHYSNAVYYIKVKDASGSRQFKIIKQ